jgi:hypothetical protein
LPPCFTLSVSKFSSATRADEFLVQIRPLFRASAALRRASRNARSVADTKSPISRRGSIVISFAQCLIFDSLIAPATALTVAILALTKTFMEMQR